MVSEKLSRLSTTETLTTAPLFKQYAKQVVAKQICWQHFKDQPDLSDLYKLLKEKACIPVTTEGHHRGAKRKAGAFNPELLAEAKRKDIEASGLCDIATAGQELAEAKQPVTVDEARAYIMKRTGLPYKDMPKSGAIRKYLLNHSILKR